MLEVIQDSDQTFLKIDCSATNQMKEIMREGTRKLPLVMKPKKDHAEGAISSNIREILSPARTFSTFTALFLDLRKNSAARPDLDTFGASIDFPFASSPEKREINRKALDHGLLQKGAKEVFERDRAVGISAKNQNVRKIKSVVSESIRRQDFEERCQQ